MATGFAGTVVAEKTKRTGKLEAVWKIGVEGSRGLAPRRWLATGWVVEVGIAGLA